MKKLLIILIIVTPRFVFSQDCDCESTFNWMKNIIENNDAGFSYIIENKGKKAFDAYNEMTLEKVKTISNENLCSEALGKWLEFFRTGHLSIKRTNNTNKPQKSNQDEEVELFKDWETVEFNIDEFNDYLKSKKNIDYEGIWKGKSFKIGIRKIKENYVGFIIESENSQWTEGQVKLKIDRFDNMTYYNDDRSISRIYKKAEFIGNDYLQFYSTFLERENHLSENDPVIEEYIKTIGTPTPFFKIIDDQTNLLRIPTFYGAKTKIDIDSVIATNKDLILKTPYLIIDIRNNGGGADRSYTELKPILYTNPTRLVWAEYLSTTLNNQRMLDFISDPSYGFNDEEKKWAQESYDKLSKRIGEFVNIDSNDVEITTFDTVYNYPKNIGIIINENVGSSGEQFLLMAKQSKKVKLFGTTTMGVLDISNMYFVKSPCENFELGYSLTRSMRIPDMTVDNIGIQPDYYMDKNIPKYEWVDFVIKTLKE